MRIKKTSATTSIQAQVVNTYNTSDSDTYSCEYINNSDSYSTSELMTNKRWIDGKPIYRKVFIGQNITPSTGLNPIGSISNLSIVIELKGTAYNSTNSLWLPLSSETNGGSFAFLEIRNSNIIPRTSEIPLDYVYVIVEYTKTTD